MRDGQASTTALLVQQGLLLSATRVSTAHLVPPDSRDASIRLLTRLPEGQGYLRQLSSLRRWQVELLERVALPGITVHHALRKRWIEEQVESAIAGGARQFVNLGAGLDTLALRLANRHEDLRLVEVDHPATQAAKQRALADEPGAERVELLPVDFTRQTLRERLPEATTFDPSVPTVVVCEGVLPYLGEADARTLFASLRDLLGSGTTVVFTFLAERSPNRLQPYGPLLKVYLAMFGESVQMRLEPDAVRALVEGEGYELLEVTNTVALLERYQAPGYRGAVHDLEMHAVAHIP